MATLLTTLLTPINGGGGSGAVDSVFGRTGSVVALNGDYTATKITNVPAGGITSTNVQAALNEIYAAIPSSGSFVPYTGATTDLNMGDYEITAAGIFSAVGNFGDLTTTGNLALPDYTPSELLATDAFKNVQNLDTSTYPSLTEISYVKGATSSIQDQINGLGGVFVPYVGANENVNLGTNSIIAGGAYLIQTDTEENNVVLHGYIGNTLEVGRLDFQKNTESDGTASLLVSDASGSLGYIYQATVNNVTFTPIVQALNFISQRQSNESVDSQTYLRFDSPFYQEFFGTNFQIAKLPEADTLQNGHAFLFINNSTGNLDIRTSLNDQLAVIPTGARQLYELTDNSNEAGVWNIMTFAPENVIWGNSELKIPFLGISELLATDDSKNIQTLSTSTYPDLTEISYVKGVTSSIQDQINAISVGGLTFNDISTTTQTVSPNNAYVTHSTSLTDFTLPTTAAFGSQFSILYLAPSAGQLLQNAGQTIIAGNQQTTSGTSGKIEDINYGDVLTVVCTSVDTEFMVVGPVGDFNVV
jgi:hypothetical protein